MADKSTQVEYEQPEIADYGDLRDGRSGNLDASDRALLLCAVITCSSFGFFWALEAGAGALRWRGVTTSCGPESSPGKMAG